MTLPPSAPPSYFSFSVYSSAIGLGLKTTVASMTLPSASPSYFSFSVSSAIGLGLQTTGASMALPSA
jgi:hypothetical protein